MSSILGLRQSSTRDIGEIILLKEHGPSAHSPSRSPPFFNIPPVCLIHVAVMTISSTLVIRQIERPPHLTVAEFAYGYIPSESIAIIFIALFGVSTALHTAQAVYFRLWWLLPTAVLCGIGEIIGWGARLWSATSPNATEPFRMQISATIIAPTPLLAASFIIFSQVIVQLGPAYSLIPPRWYAWVFVPCDAVALVVQGVGGGIAAAAQDRVAAQRGANIMLGGIGFQFAVIVLFSLLAADFVVRYLCNAPWRSTALPGGISNSPTRGPLTRRLAAVLAALGFSTTVLFIRSVYRMIELAGGWHGRVIRTELYFNVLDGAMIVLAIFTWNFVHPGWFLSGSLAAGGDGRRSNEHKGLVMAMRSDTKADDADCESHWHH
ncbi:hypothetical protein MIND_00586500 [Mycena indigotica]|uniref:RTA1-domain-containing protein n=1 Tax=Mycena indigotica TaxID=2126181 RepID=A0A8H6W3G1_9AGAR|nr:uncharacterized protein MIND_00586500 [Mycena indigotica]KAF7303572.1 hypothetical protein MIND_00586500 [Mycena indigotica]